MSRSKQWFKHLLVIIVVTLSWAALAVPPVNDNFADRTEIAGESGNTTGTNAEATLEDEEPSYGYSSVWWTYTPSVSGTLVVDTIGSNINGSNFDTKLGVYTGSAVDALTTVDNGRDDDSGGSGTSKITLSVVADTAYQIAVTSYDPSDTGSIILNWSLVQPPANDNFVDRITITGESDSTTGTTVGATSESGEPNYGPSSIWWAYTPSANGALLVNTVGSSVDTLLGIYTGSSVDSLTIVAQDDNGGDNGDGSGASKVYMPVTAGTQYQIAITSNTAGDVSLNWEFSTPPQPANDNFANRITITDASGSTTGTTVGATLEAGEPSYGHSSVWWTYTPPVNGTLVVDTNGSTFDTKLGIYTGLAVGALATVSQGTSSVSISVSAGTQYQIAVTSSNSIGDVALMWTFTQPPANDNFANRITISGLSGSTSGNNAGAATEVGEPSYGYSSVWWRYTPSVNGILLLDTAGSAYTSYLGIYTGSSVDALGIVAQGPDSISVPMVAGTEYQIAVTSYYSYGTGSITLTWGLTPSPDNDNFADRLEISGEFGSITGTTVAATTELGEPDYGPSSVWWTYTPTASGALLVDTIGSLTGASLGVYTGLSVESLTTVAQDDYSGKVYIPVTAGTQYQIAITSFSTDGTGDVSLNWEFRTPPQPTNDNFVNRITISGASDSTTGTTIGATLEAGEPDHGHSSVWWRYIPATTGLLVVYTRGSSVDTMLGIYTGSTVSALTKVVQGDDFISIPVTAGTEYQIAVTSRYSIGDVTLNWRLNSFPANDNFANRINISGMDGASGTTAGATTESGEPSYGDSSVWWRYIPAIDGLLVVDTNGSNRDTMLGIYTGSAVDALTIVGQNDDGGSFGASKITISVLAGTEYQIAVTTSNSYGYGAGSVKLNLKISPHPANDNFANRITISGASGSTTGTTEGATSEPGEPDYRYYSVWWKYIPTTTGILVLDTSGSSYTSYLGIYTGSSVNSLTTVVQNSYSASIKVVAGTEYQIAVTSYYRGSINLTWSLNPLPVNDNFVDRITLSGVSGSVTGTTTSATSEPGEPIDYGNNSVWWRYIPPANGSLSVSTDGSLLPTRLTIYTGSTVGALTTVGIGDEDSITMPVVAGTEYQIAVTTGYPMGSSVLLNWTFTPSTPAPSNDNFADRITIVGQSASTTGTNSGATTETGEPDYGSSSVWWTYTPSENGALVLDTKGSLIDTKLGVYTGLSVNSLTKVAQDDNGGDDGDGSGASKVYIPVTAGTQYQIAITSPASSTGAVSLNWEFSTPPQPANDNFVNRINITGFSGTMMGTTAGATLEASEPSYGHSSVWWKYTAPANGTLVVDTIGSTFDTKLGIYTGSPVGALTTVSQGTSSVLISVTSGTEYQIAVTSSNSIGDVILNWRLTISPIVLGNTLSQGNLKVTVYPDGRVGIARAMIQAETLQWVNQIYYGDNKGSRLMINGSGYGIGYYSGTAPVLLSHNLQDSSTAVTVWTAGSAQVTQTVTYVDGDTVLRFKWDIVNNGSTELTNMRWFHGDDTYLLGSDAGGGFWDAATNTVGVQKTLNGQRLALVLQGETTPFAYESRGYGAVKGSVNNGALQSIVDPTEGIDNGYALEWRSASLAAGTTWSVNALERFVATPLVASISPNSGGVAGGTSVTVTGSAFRPDSTVYFGTAAAASTTFVSDAEVHCVTPAHVSGIVDVRVVNPDQSAGQLPACFTFNAPPTITLGFDRSVKPTSAAGAHFVLPNAVQDDGYVQAMTCAWSEGQTPLGTTASLDCNLPVGAHVITCAADDGMFQVTRSVTITVLSNDPPVANAGVDRTVMQTEQSGVSVTLDGTASTDDGAWQGLTYTWTEGAVTLGTGATLQKTFTEGVHTVTLTVSDGEFQRTDDLVITVRVNQPPVANAGTDQSVLQATLSGATATLDGRASTDDGMIQALTYTWSEGGATLGTGTTLQRVFSVGAHTVTLTVDDGQYQSTDDVIITIRPNQQPVANAGADQNVLQTSQAGATVILDGRASTDDGAIQALTYTWTEGVISLGTGATLEQTFAVGTHTVTLTVDDGQYQSTDDVVVTVTSPLPDLIVKSVTFAPFIDRGTVFNVAVTVKNTAGNGGTAIAPWVDRVTLVDKDGIETAIGAYTHAAALGSGEERSYTVAYQVPANLSTDSTYRVCVKADADGQVSEQSEVNNSLTYPEDKDSPQVAVVRACDYLPMNLTSADMIAEGVAYPIQWTVKNNGTGVTPKSWSTTLIISDKPALADALADTSRKEITHVASIEPGLEKDGESTFNTSMSIDSTVDADGDNKLYLHIVTDSTGGVLEINTGNTAETNNSLTRTGAITVEFVNLAISNLAAPGIASKGKPYNFSWKVTNTGTKSVSDTWNDRLYLSADATAGGDIELGTFARLGTLASGESYTQTQSIVIPDSATLGSCWLVVVADADANVTERNESDNMLVYGPFTIRNKQNPVVAITSPTSGVVNAVGAEISFAANSSDFEDGVLTGASLVWMSDKDGQIGTGSTFTKSDLSQNVHVISVTATDSDGMTATASTTVFVGQLSNLTMQSASGPAKSAPGAEIDLTWTVKNTGTKDLTGDWSDRVFISTDNLVGGDTLLCSVPRAFGLQPNRQYVQQRTAKLPNDLADGTYWLIFTTDADNGITENDEGDNTTVFGPMTVSKPDLMPSDFNFTGDVYSGKNIQLSWKVSNQGSGPTAGIWADAIYLSSNNQPGSGILLQKFDRPKNLTANDSYTQNRQVTLPAMTPGNHWLSLVTDTDNTVSESDETNNALVTGPINVQSANLTVSDFTATGLLSPGGEVTLSWKVTNNGAVPIIPEWNDQLFFSADNQIGGDTPLAKFKRPGTMLNPGASYTCETKATLPAVTAGDYFIYIKTDTDNVIQETNENDNCSALIPINMQFSNLTVSIGSIFPNASVNAQKTVSWTVRNTGTTSLNQTWYDSVYLSTDDQFGGDILLTGVIRSSALQPGAEYPNMASVTIPNVPAGQYWIIVKTDSMSNVAETDETDNTVVSAPFNLVLPNLTASAIQFPSEVYYGQTVEVKWKDSNIGEGDALPSWQDGIYLSTDQAVGGDTQIEVFTQTTPVLSGKSADASLKFRVPQVTAGNYYLMIKSDDSGQVNESDETDNAVFTGSFSIGPAPYDATVEADADNLIVGNPTAPVTFTGLATYIASGLPVPNSPVKLHLTVRGIKRTFDATTDASGHYSYVFQPIANEAGAYSIAATHPALNDAAAEDTFRILGMCVSTDDYSSYKVTLIPGKPMTLKLQIKNLGDVPLAGLAGALSSPPSNISATVQVPSDLTGEGQVEALVSLTASDTSTATADVNLTITSSEGASAPFPLSLKVWPETANLVATPSFLEAGMLRSEQAFVEFAVANNGGVKANNVRVSLPTADWLTLTSPASLGSLEPAASTKITLCLKPSADLALGPYTGNITLNLDNGAPRQVPFNFKCVSEGKGDLEVTVQDQLTYLADTHPNVVGAKVTVMNPFNNAEIISEAVTDATGIVSFQSLPAGRYSLKVIANRHSPALRDIEVVQGVLNKKTVYINKNLVTATFTAEFIEIEDTYNIKIVSTFETHVPAPVVVISPGLIYVELDENGESEHTLTVTNYGLITANDFKLNLPVSDKYEFTALANCFDIPAMTAVEIPVKVKTKTATPLLTSAPISVLAQSSRISSRNAPKAQNNSSNSTDGVCGVILRETGDYFWLYCFGEETDKTYVDIEGPVIEIKEGPNFDAEKCYDEIRRYFSQWNGGGGGGWWKVGSGGGDGWVDPGPGPTESENIICLGYNVPMSYTQQGRK